MSLDPSCKRFAFITVPAFVADQERNKVDEETFTDTSLTQSFLVDARDGSASPTWKSLGDEQVGAHRRIVVQRDGVVAAFCAETHVTGVGLPVGGRGRGPLIEERRHGVARWEDDLLLGARLGLITIWRSLLVRCALLGSCWLSWLLGLRASLRANQGRRRRRFGLRCARHYRLRWGRQRGAPCTKTSCGIRVVVVVDADGFLGAQSDREGPRRAGEGDR